METYQWVLIAGAVIFVLGMGWGIWKGNGDDRDSDT